MNEFDRLQSEIDAHEAWLRQQPRPVWPNASADRVKQAIRVELAAGRALTARPWGRGWGWLAAAAMLGLWVSTVHTGVSQARRHAERVQTVEQFIRAFESASGADASVALLAREIDAVGLPDSGRGDSDLDDLMNSVESAGSGATESDV
ncbi:MAG: hypothetical protein U1A27_00860 [Phycisphaerae bacterium]